MIKIIDTTVWGYYNSLPYIHLKLMMYPPPKDLSNELGILKALREGLDKAIKEQEVDVAKESARKEVRKAVSDIEEKYDLKLKVTIE